MSERDEVTDDVHALLRDGIEDLDRLQLLLLVLAARDRAFTAEEVADFTRLPPDAAAEALAALCRAGLLERSGSNERPSFRYAPGSAGLAASVDSLAAAWRRNPVTIVRLLSERAIERVRMAALRTFADAFVLGRKDNG